MKLIKNIDYKRKVLIGLSINFIILIVIIYFFVIPYSKHVLEANQRLIDNRVQFETKLIKEEKFSKISKNITKIEDNMRKIEESFINQNNKLEFITMFEGLADENSVHMDMKIDFETITPQNKSPKLNLTLTGNYTNLMNFLVSIENLKYYINITKININASPSNSINRSMGPNNSLNNSSLTMNIEAITHWK